MGKLIVIDGVDASGKETQAKILCEKLRKKYGNEKIIQISFPMYDSEESILVKNYLAGTYGKTATSVNPYAASMFYAADRYASYKKEKIGWEEFYSRPDTIIIADRYVSSNKIHQASKLTGAEKDIFLEWLDTFEYEQLGLPRPDKMIFLDMPIWAGQKLMANRANKITGEAQKDIHEADTSYLQASYDNAMYIANKYNWNIVKCTNGKNIKTIEDISDEIYEIAIK